jgi:hypothetical protein
VRARLVVRRGLGVLLAAAVGGSLLSGCAAKRVNKNTIKDAIHRTQRLGRSFVYTDQAGDATTVVAGLVEDDFRYKSRVTVNGKAILDEVVSDDVLADRFNDPNVLGKYVKSGTQGASSTGSTDVLEALQSQLWVIDKTGAPAAQTGNRQVGIDPSLDAIGALTYVEKAVEAALYTAPFRPDALQPVYKPTEDPFPKPEKGSRTERWDLKEIELPQSADNRSGNQATPTVSMFRKMAIYIRDGLVIQVREVIDVASKLDKLRKTFGLDKQFAGLNADQQVTLVVNAINEVRKGQGTDAIRLRQMTLDLKDLGKPTKVDLPTDFVAGDLSILRLRGRAASNALATPTPAAAGG